MMLRPSRHEQEMLLHPFHILHSLVNILIAHRQGKYVPGEMNEFRTPSTSSTVADEGSFPA